MNRKMPVVLLLIILAWPVPARASLAVHPLALRDTIAPGATHSIVLHVTNRGPADPLGYTVTESSDWLSATPAFGEITVGDTVSVVVTVDAAALVPGSYRTDLTVIDPHHGPIAIPVELSVQSVTAVRPGGIRYLPPLGFSLHQNYPNPFNPSTTISFSVPARERVKMKVFNLLGQEVATLIDGDIEAGDHALTWDAAGLGSGVYFYKLEGGSQSVVRRMLIAK